MNPCPSFLLKIIQQSTALQTPSATGKMKFLITKQKCFGLNNSFLLKSHLNHSKMRSIPFPSPCKNCPFIINGSATRRAPLSMKGPSQTSSHRPRIPSNCPLAAVQLWALQAKGLQRLPLPRRCEPRFSGDAPAPRHTAPAQGQRRGCCYRAVAHQRP